MLVRVGKFALIGAVATIFTGCNQPEPNRNRNHNQKLSVIALLFNNVWMIAIQEW